MDYLRFLDPLGRERFISCVSVLPPAKVCYSSSERPVDALLLPLPVATGFRDLLNEQYALGCSVVCGAVTANG